MIPGLEIGGRFVSAARRVLQPANNPNFLIIGAQKCATSSLHYYLNQHPQISGSRVKELRYFNTGRYDALDIGKYRGSFRGPRTQQYYESTPGYLYSASAPERIHQHYPEIKMVVVLRDPVQRAFSAWNHFRQLFESGAYIRRANEKYRLEGNLLYEKLFIGRRDFPDFGECLAIELELIKNEQGFEPSLIRRGRYLEQLERYWQLFPERNILILGFRQLGEDTVGTLGIVADFLQVEGGHWDNLDFARQNSRNYVAAMSESDRALLSAYYAPLNQQLFERIGGLNW